MDKSYSLKIERLYNPTIGVSTAWPSGAKRPVLFIGNEYCATAVASFRDENAMNAFWEQFELFLKSSGMRIEEPEYKAITGKEKKQ